jgi:hypothetical protein
MLLRSTLMTILLTAALALPTLAHHSLKGYDQTTVVTLRGIVTEIQWMNPHTSITLAVSNPDGTVFRRQIEMAAPNGLVRKGFDRAFLKIGDPVTLETWMPQDLKTNAKFNGRTLILADGRRFDVGDLWSFMNVSPITERPR